jgi:hypothetical protein
MNPLIVSCLIYLVHQDSEQSSLGSLFKEYLKKEVDLQPFLGTRLGDHRHADRLESLSIPAQQQRLNHHQETLKILSQISNRSNMKLDDRVDLETWINHEKRWIWNDMVLKPLFKDPRSYSEYISDSTFLLITQTTLPKDRIIQACLARTREIPRIVNEAKINLSLPDTEKPARVFVETAIRQNLGSIAWYRSGMLNILSLQTGSNELKLACEAAAKALESYHKYLSDELLPISLGDWRLGIARYDEKLVLDLESPLSRMSIRKKADNEFMRVTKAMEILSRDLWPQLINDQPVPKEGTNPRSVIGPVLKAASKDRGTVSTLVADARLAANDLKAFIRQRNLLDLPTPDRCDIVEMPEFQRGNSVAYLNNAPPLDLNARSVYAISPPPSDWDSRRVDSFLDEYNRRMMRILTLHEAYPGHYVQLEYGNRHPSLIRKVLSSGVYIEGWAVHMEQVMLDEGYAMNDAPLRLLQLKWYLRAVANAILDQGMHCDNWTDEKALRFLVDEAYQSEGEAIGKITRSKQSSCQLSTYFVGRTAMHDVRLETQDRLGKNFNIKAYYHAVLGVGAVPVRHLGTLIRDALP